MCYATEAELIMPMCVVLGTLELSDSHVSFIGERFGGLGTGIGKTTRGMTHFPAEFSSCACSACSCCSGRFFPVIFPILRLIRLKQSKPTGSEKGKETHVSA